MHVLRSRARQTMARPAPLPDPKKAGTNNAPLSERHSHSEDPNMWYVGAHLHFKSGQNGCFAKSLEENRGTRC